jgi:YD repeat-containing protein
MQMKNILKLFYGAAILSLASNVHAQEIQTYSYDAKGRLIKVERDGGVQDGEDSDYTYDAANNRTSVATTDAQPINSAKFLPVGGKIIVVPQSE